MHFSSPPCVLHVPFLSFFFIGSPVKSIWWEVQFMKLLITQLGRDNSVSISTCYGLDDPVIESQCGGEIFRTRPDRPWGLLSPCTMHTGLYPGVKRPGRGVDRPCPSRAEVKERVELYLYSPLYIFMAGYWGELCLFILLWRFIFHFPVSFAILGSNIFLRIQGRI